MPAWTLKTPRNDDPKELLRFLQELIQYLKYISEHLDGDNVPMLKKVNAQLKDLDLSVERIDNKYAMAFAELEDWKAVVESALNL